MLQLGDGLVLFSTVFVVVLVGTRSAVWPTVLAASLYLFLVMFRFPQVPSSRARQVLRPGSRVHSGGVSAVAHRGGGHDAPENTIAAIRAVSTSVWCFCLILMRVMDLKAVYAIFKCQTKEKYHMNGRGVEILFLFISVCVQCV